MRKTTQFIAAAIASVPAIAMAHPGHGAAADQGLMHQLMDHGWMIGLGVAAIGAVTFAVRRARR